MSEKVFYTNPGSPIRPVYSPLVLDDGTIEVVQTGEENLQEFIDSFKDSTDINILVQRMYAGDETALNQRKGMYGDFTNMPKTYAEFLQKVIDAGKFFDSLPTDIKVKFDNDINKFLVESMSPDFAEKIGIVTKVVPPSEAVKEEADK